VQKADLQRTDGADPDHVAADETVVQLNNERLGCALRSVPRRTTYYTSSSLWWEVTHLPRRVLSNLAEHISSVMRSVSSILHRGGKPRATNTASITATKNVVVGTALNVSAKN